MQLIKALISSVNAAKKIFTSSGRYDETFTGRIYQHYAFKSNPPVNTRHIVLQDGVSKSLSIAEDDGIGIELSSGDAVVGFDNDNKIYLTKSGNTLMIKFTGNITIQTSGKVYIGDSGSKKKLATEDFVLSVYNTHTHAGVTTGGSSTAVPSALGTTAHMTDITRAD